MAALLQQTFGRAVSHEFVKETEPCNLVLAELQAELDCGFQQDKIELPARDLANDALRAEYDLGWSASQVTRNAQGLCALKIDESGALCAVPTADPSSSVNLEYLAIALNVRVREGREPFFSLDPVDSFCSGSEWMQKKRFEPEWIAGTSAGEVMFQADYQLKELSMGACEQPVAGMKNVFDSLEREGFDSTWSAREWFVVRKAEIQVSDDGVITPMCKMGVEAREQLKGGAGLEDSKITRPDHPLVKYAEEFTRNFDLIAERKSVIYHLRELAKASIMAKYLVDAEISMDDSWFTMGEVQADCAMEVPAAKNERNHELAWNSVFGGVQFGIDRFSLSAPSAAMVTRAGRISAPLGAMSAARVSAPLAAMAHARISAPLGAMSAARVSAPLRAMSAARVSAPIGAMRAARGRPLASMARVSAPIAALSAATARAPLAWGASRLAAARPLTSTMSLAAGLERPQGVDLDLNKFDLSSTHRVDKASMASWEDAELAPLFRAIFNPQLSDRKEDGDLFVAPEATFSVIKKLQSLTKSEDVVRSERKAHFLSDKFDSVDAGTLFPITWREGKSSEIPARRSRSEFVNQVAAFTKALASASPTFDKATEDGMRFRVYKFGSLEVRSTAEQDEQEIVGAVFQNGKTSDLKSYIFSEMQKHL